MKLTEAQRRMTDEITDFIRDKYASKVFCSSIVKEIVQDVSDYIERKYGPFEQDEDGEWYAAPGSPGYVECGLVTMEPHP